MAKTCSACNSKWVHPVTAGNAPESQAFAEKKIAPHICVLKYSAAGTLECSQQTISIVF